MLALPLELGALATIAPKKDTSPRYSLHGVHLEATADGWTASATDCKSLVLVEGDNPEGYPNAIPALEAAPNGATSALVPRESWKAAFAAAKKLTGKARSELLRRCGVVMGQRVVTFGATDGVRADSSAAEAIAGRYPMVRQIIPRRAPKWVLPVDAYRLAEMLRVVGEMCQHDGFDGPRVVLECHGTEAPLVIRTDDPAAGFTKVLGLVMPMGERDVRNPLATPAAAADDHADERLEQSVADELRAEVGAWKELATANDLEVGKLRAALEKAERDAAGQSATIDFLRAEADAANELLARFKDQTEHGSELAGLWGRLGDAERTTRDAVAESERLRAELDAVHADRERLLADVEALRKLAVPTHRPTPPVIHHRPAATPGVRPTLGELAAAAKGGA